MYLHMLLTPSTVPCSVVLARPFDLVSYILTIYYCHIVPIYINFVFFTMVATHSGVITPRSGVTDVDALKKRAGGGCQNYFQPLIWLAAITML